MSSILVLSMYVCMYVSMYRLENSNFSKVPECCLSLSEIYAEPQHKLLFRVVRGGGGDFELRFGSVYLSIYVSIYLSIYRLENSNFLKVPELCLSLRNDFSEKVFAKR